MTRVALDIGYRHFDCAEFYGNEEVVGEGLAPFVASGKRDESCCPLCAYSLASGLHARRVLRTLA